MFANIIKDIKTDRKACHKKVTAARGLRRLEVKCIPGIRVTGKQYYEKRFAMLRLSLIPHQVRELLLYPRKQLSLQ